MGKKKKRKKHTQNSQRSEQPFWELVRTPFHRVSLPYFQKGEQRRTPVFPTIAVGFTYSTKGICTTWQEDDEILHMI